MIALKALRFKTDGFLAAASKDGGYIASPAQGMREDTPVENLLALVDEVKKLG
jgi:hypothetical protein